MRIKRALRPLIPDRVMARYRLAQHSRQVRTNVDVVLAGKGERRRWLGATPDTYRVVEAPAHTAAEEPLRDVVAFGGELERAMRLVALPDAEVGVVARVEPPTIVGRRRRQPPMDPVAIAAPSTAIAEVGGLPEGDSPLSGLLDRLRDAGRRIALDPVVVHGPVDSTRTDPISVPSVVILAAVPMHDVGGGSRATQLALEFVRSGYHVTYVALYGTQESTDIGLRFIHPHLEQTRADVFVAAALRNRIAHPGLVMVEAPAPGFRGPVEALRKAGFTIVYDIIDDWSDPALGGDWYDTDTETWFIRTADHVTASASDLADRAARLGTPTVLVPNAVNTDVFGGVTGADPPVEFPSGDGPVFGYVGSLYGEWFDWDALRAVAVAFPAGHVVVIGDDKGGHPDMPGNVSFLGLKAQFELPPYVRRFDVGLLPFTVSDTTHAVSPLKVYEYLASSVPVAAPPLRALEGLDGVAVDDDLVTAVRRALAGPAVDGASVRDRHSWRERVETLIELTGIERATESAPAKIVRRPAVHYGKNDRVVGE